MNATQSISHSNFWKTALLFRFLPIRIREKWRAILAGTLVGLGIYLTPLIAMTFFYVPQPPESHYDLFTTEIIYSLSWLVVTGGFAGYTAFLIRSDIS